MDTWFDLKRSSVLQCGTSNPGNAALLLFLTFNFSNKRYLSDLRTFCFCNLQLCKRNEPLIARIRHSGFDPFITCRY